MSTPFKTMQPYSKKEYAEVTFEASNPKRPERTVLFEVVSKTINFTSGFVVKKNGERTVRRGKPEALILHHADMVKYQPLRLNLGSCRLEKP